MSLHFSQIRNILYRKADMAMHRHVVVLAGDKNWQECSLKNILSDFEQNVLYVGAEVFEDFPSVLVKKARSWLGREKQVVIFDANTQFDADAFAAISGIVIGGGLFILLMPAKNQWNEIYSSNFGKRLIKSIQDTRELIVVCNDDKKIKVIQDEIEKKSSAHYDEPFLTLDQQRAVELIEKEVLDKNNFPVVLISDRGRGKSAALGIAIARLLVIGIKSIIITAPRLRSTDIVFKHIEALLPESKVTRGKVKYNNSVVQFYSPDHLLAENIKSDLLFVDEAAAIPVPILTSFLYKYTHCFFATTVHGYEGTGRGFALRFNNILNEQKPGWKKHLMQTPVRWAENDPLEKWMFSLLCLDAEIIESSSIGEVDTNKINIKQYNKSELAEDNVLLNDVFSLLVLAHYRTQPSDLLRLLDDTTISLYIVKHNQYVISVALVSHEGLFSKELSTQVYRGERRPPGHLLAQAITYHCGIEHAATLSYARIMRIAVHPSFQQQGIGSKLINFIIENEMRAGYDAVGSSFGMNEKLLRFWLKSGFNVIRIGFKREQTSGEHAAIMLLPLSDAGTEINKEACSRFAGQLSYWFDDVLKNISDDLKDSFCLAAVNLLSLTPYEKKDLDSFLQYSRNYELCISSLNKFIMAKQNEIAEDDFPIDFRMILNKKVLMKTNWKNIGNDMGLNSQNEARKLFNNAVAYLVSKQKNI